MKAEDKAAINLNFDDVDTRLGRTVDIASTQTIKGAKYFNKVGVSTVQFSDGTTQTTAASGGLSIGDAISGGTAGRVLFEGTGNVLAEDSDLQFGVETTSATRIRSKNVLLDNSTGSSFVGDEDGNGDRGQFLAPAGTGSYMGFGFSQASGGDNTGFKYGGALSISVGGSAKFNIDESGLQATGGVGGSVSSASSGESDPAFYFPTDTNTGVWRPRADAVGLTAGGNGNLIVSTGSLYVPFPGVPMIFEMATSTPPTNTSTALIWANQVATAAEMKVKDGLGNVTQISPHDPETGEWVFFSENTTTGRKVRINMERMVRRFEELTGEKFLIENKPLEER